MGIGKKVIFNRRLDKWLSRLAHNQKIVGSNPTPATNFSVTTNPKEVGFGVIGM